MKAWTILEYVIGFILFGILLRLAQPYAPPQLSAVFTALDAVYNALSSIITIAINTLISILQIIKGLIPD